MGEEINQVLLEFICRYERTAEVCRAGCAERMSRKRHDGYLRGGNSYPCGSDEQYAAHR